MAGTLRAGWERLAELDTAFERAVYVMFLVSEVHPFDDGNGRLARVMMNTELVAGTQSRIIVPTVFRDDYLGGLRRLTRQDDPMERPRFRGDCFSWDSSSVLSPFCFDGTSLLASTAAFPADGLSVSELPLSGLSTFPGVL